MHLALVTDMGLGRLIITVKEKGIRVILFLVIKIYGQTGLGGAGDTT